MVKFKYEKYDYTKIGIGYFNILATDFSSNLIAVSNAVAERELTAILSEQVAAEIDRQILEYLRQNYE